MTITADIQKLELDARVDVYEIDFGSIGFPDKYLFHNGVNGLGNNVVWQGQEYTRWPIAATGFEWSGSGSQPRPRVSVANITGLAGAIAKEYQDLIRVKFVRRSTLLKYLDEVNFPGGVNPEANPDMHLRDEIYFFDQKVSEDSMEVVWELASGADLTGKFLPGRQCTQNACIWKSIGGYRGPYCGYTGPAIADINDQPTSNMALDNCGGRLNSCKIRFPAPQAIRFGGQPAIGLLSK